MARGARRVAPRLAPSGDGRKGRRFLECGPLRPLNARGAPTVKRNPIAHAAALMILPALVAGGGGSDPVISEPPAALRP